MKQFKFPFGLRMLKSVLAVAISAAVVKYLMNGTPFFACIGAVVAMERTIASSVQAAIIRNLGTFVGGVVGIAIAYLFSGPVSDNSVFLAFGIIPVIYLINRIKKNESIIPGCIVYFAVVFLNTAESAGVYGVKRITETLIGSVIAIVINLLIFPPKKKGEDAQSKTEEEAQQV